jgi:Bacillus/Clostridium GerA spore germination protein
MYKNIFNKYKEPLINSLTFDQLIKIAKKSSDFSHINRCVYGTQINIFYFSSLINHEVMQRSFLPYLSSQPKEQKTKVSKQICNNLPIEEIIITNNVKDIEDKLHKGHILIQVEDDSKEFILININNPSDGIRKNNESENEFSVIGPKMGFVEDLDTNMYLLRRKINTPILVMKELIIGTMSKTRVMIVYLDGITNENHVKTVTQRLNDLDFDIVWDTSTLDQIISDNSNSPFPLYLSTERIDRVTYALVNGQVAIFSDGSPYVISGPSTLLDFFISPEDYYYNWVIGSFFRLIRIIGVIFSIFSTSFYVAITTYHYPVIPMDLLGPLIESRANVPFPPFLEVIFLEVTIELLREAGARLPTKVGQTLGIVGGIVIGQAAVAAALTSNVLLIIVALSALASFTTPTITMSNTIRLLRFPFIILSSLFGGLGIIFGFVILLRHLFGLRSFETPYMVPLFPFRKKAYVDSFIRSSYRKINMRASYLRPIQSIKYQPKIEKRNRGGINDE